MNFGMPQLTIDELKSLIIKKNSVIKGQVYTEDIIVEGDDSTIINTQIENSTFNGVTIECKIDRLSLIKCKIKSLDISTRQSRNSIVFENCQIDTINFETYESEPSQ
jgi:hypothetical protein